MSVVSERAGLLTPEERQRLSDALDVLEALERLPDGWSLKRIRPVAGMKWKLLPAEGHELYLMFSSAEKCAEYILERFPPKEQK